MRFETDRAAAQELKLFTENDGDLYRQQTTSILNNLATKKASGKYNHDLAVKIFMYLAESGAKKYAKEFGSVWNLMFPVSTRKMVATEWRDEFEVEYANGSYDHLLPKKYQGLLGNKYQGLLGNSFLQKRRMRAIARKKNDDVTLAEAEDALAISRYLGDEKLHARFEKVVASLKKPRRRHP